MANGTSVALLGAGAVMAYASVTGKSPLQALFYATRGEDPRTAKQTQGIDVKFGGGGSASGVSGGAAAIVMAACESMLGKAYQLGAPLNPATPNPPKADCSGLAQWSWHKAGVKITHNTVSQIHELKALKTKRPVANAMPGDLVFFGIENAPHHVGVYAGGGMIYEAADYGIPIRKIAISAKGEKPIKYVGIFPGNPALDQNVAIVNIEGSAGASANKALARMLMTSYGWGADQFPALESLWTRESGWSNTADTRKTGSGGDHAGSSEYAYGIAQARPASKYPKAGQPSDMGGRSDSKTQIVWGLQYIKRRYGSPSAALAHENSNGWY